MKTSHRDSDKRGSRLVFWMKTAVHDNRLLSFFRDPTEILKKVGLEKGHQMQFKANQ
jgi:hypothetical protein